MPHWKGERRIRRCHDLSQISARFDGNLTVVTYIRHQWLRNFPRLSIAGYPVNLGKTSKLPTKPSAVCVLGRRALRGSGRFSSTVSIRQKQVPLADQEGTTGKKEKLLLDLAINDLIQSAGDRQAWLSFLSGGHAE